jgi:Uma2 family endonuclease
VLRSIDTARGVSVTLLLQPFATWTRAHLPRSAEEAYRMPMATETAEWTIAQRDRLPDDGNKYEVVGGELFVTPSPSRRHQWIADELCDLLKPYVAEHGLGSALAVNTDVIRGEKDVVVPDVAVYPVTREDPDGPWSQMPRPILVAEICSPTTWRRDVGPKRDLYVALGVAEYWIVDADERVITVVRAGHADERVSDVLRWHPAGAARPLEIDLRTLLR